MERFGERSGKFRSKKWKVSEKEVENLEFYKVHFDIEEVERFVVRCGRIWRKKWKVWSLNKSKKWKIWSFYFANKIKMTIIFSFQNFFA